MIPRTNNPSGQMRLSARTQPGSWKATEDKEVVPEHCQGEITAQTTLHLYRDSGRLTLRVF